MRKRLPPKPVEAEWELELRLLSEKMAPYGIEAGAEQIQRLRRYCQELVSWNPRHALLSHGDLQHVVTKHIGASLGVLLLARPSPDADWVDVGTGAGLPGLVLKIWDPSLQITLIESARKRCVFLEHIARCLDLGEVPIHAARAETLLARGEGFEAFDLLLARAVADVGTTLKRFGDLVRPGGRVITHKGERWIEDVERARTEGHLDAGAYVLESTTQIPWALGHLLEFRKS